MFELHVSGGVKALIVVPSRLFLIRILGLVWISGSDFLVGSGFWFGFLGFSMRSQLIMRVERSGVAAGAIALHYI